MYTQYSTNAYIIVPHYIDMYTSPHILIHKLTLFVNTVLEGPTFQQHTEVPWPSGFQPTFCAVGFGFAFDVERSVETMSGGNEGCMVVRAAAKSSQLIC